MIVVVDASVATKWFFAEVDDVPARKILSSANILIAPDLIVAEVCNAVRRKFELAESNAKRALQIAAGLPQMFRELVPARALAPRALEIAMDLRHPIYDCFYLALAEFANTAVVTADAHLVRVTQRAGFPQNRIRLLGTNG